MPTHHEPWADTELCRSRVRVPTGTSSSVRSTRLHRTTGCSATTCTLRAATRSIRPKLRCYGSSTGTWALTAASYHASGCTSRGWLSRRASHKIHGAHSVFHAAFHVAFHGQIFHHTTINSPHTYSVCTCRLQVVGEAEWLTPADCAFLQSRHPRQELQPSQWLDAVHAAQQRMQMQAQRAERAQLQQIPQAQRAQRIPQVQRVKLQPQRLHEPKTQWVQVQSQAPRSRLPPRLFDAGGVGGMSKLSRDLKIPPAVGRGTHKVVVQEPSRASPPGNPDVDVRLRGQSAREYSKAQHPALSTVYRTAS